MFPRNIVCLRNVNTQHKGGEMMMMMMIIIKIIIIIIIISAILIDQKLWK